MFAKRLGSRELAACAPELQQRFEVGVISSQMVRFSPKAQAPARPVLEGSSALSRLTLTACSLRLVPKQINK